MKILHTLFAAALVATLSAPDADAQQAPHNRRVDGVGVTQSAQPGVWDVQVAWTAELGTTISVDLELATEVVVFVDGVETASEFVDVVAFAGAGGCGSCAPGCGDGAVNGMAAALLCLDEGQVGCSCQFPPITSNIPVPLDAGQEVTVWLRPVAGAAPELDTSDDRSTQTFDGVPIGWDRRIERVELVPTPGAPAGVYDLEIDWSVLLSQITQQIELTPAFVVSVNGAVFGQFEPDCGPWFAAPGLGCALVNCPGDPCATITCNGSSTTLRCNLTENDYGLQYCACTSDPYCLVVPGLTFLQPGDVVEVQLVPMPGALPELPGFGEDEEPVDVPHPAWKDLGHALAGTHGEPELVGTGTMIGGDAIELTLAGARENAKAWAIVGLADLSAPFKGGVLVPDPAPPALVLAFPTAPDGTAQLAAALPVGLPSGFELFAQWWIDDDAGPAGFAASNAVLGVTP